MVNFTEETAGLVLAISNRASTKGPEAASKMAAAADPLLEWVGHLHHSELTGVCDQGIDGVRSLILEAVCGASAGLYRSCILSLRGQIDLVLTWLYFKDHPKEWERVMRENEGYKLKKDVLEYLRYYYPVFEPVFGALKAKRFRAFEDPYRVLSAHVHSIGENTVPDLTSFADVVGSDDACEDCVRLQSDVTEYLGDVLISCFAPKWASLPPSLLDVAKGRLGSEKFASLIK